MIPQQTVELSSICLPIQHLPAEESPAVLYRSLLLSTALAVVLLFYHPYTEKLFFRQTSLNPVSTSTFLFLHSQQPDTKYHCDDVPTRHISRISINEACLVPSGRNYFHIVHTNRRNIFQVVGGKCKVLYRILE